MAQTQQSASKSAYIRARVTPDLKAESEAVLRELGLSLTEAITMFLAQVKAQKGIPFDVKIPNAETIAAFEEAKDPSKLLRYPDIDTAFAEMLADDDNE